MIETAAVTFLKLIGILIAGFLLIVYVAPNLFNLFHKLNSRLISIVAEIALIFYVLLLWAALVASLALSYYHSASLSTFPAICFYIVILIFFAAPLFALWFSSGDQFQRRRQATYAQASTIAFIVFSFKPDFVLRFFPHISHLVNALGF